MFKKFIGVVAVLAILALIIMTALGAGTYSTMLPESLFSGVAEVESATEVESVDMPSAAPAQITE